MKTWDRLFIFLSIVLIILFMISVLENMTQDLLLRRARLNAPYAKDLENKVKNNISEILTRLEDAGLEPHEARYYE